MGALGALMLMGVARKVMLGKTGRFVRSRRSRPPLPANRIRAGDGRSGSPGVARGTSISSLRTKLTNCSHHCLGRLAWEEMSRDGHDPSLIWAGREAVVALR